MPLSSSSSWVTSKEQCPRCKQLGKDRSEDNLAVYSDGHKFCFSCGYGVYLNGIDHLKSKLNPEASQLKEELIYLPVDCDVNYPKRVLSWLNLYKIGENDLYKHNVMWSESMQRLIFPVYNTKKDRALTAWQGRAFHLSPAQLARAPKWFGRGNLKQTLNIIGSGSTLVIVEDILSAIKITKAGSKALPIYGSFIGRDRFKEILRYLDGTKKVYVWLDKDKWKESVREARMARLCGLDCGVINTDLDPKLVSLTEIRNKLTRN